MVESKPELLLSAMSRSTATAQQGLLVSMSIAYITTREYGGVPVRVASSEHLDV